MRREQYGCGGKRHSSDRICTPDGLGTSLNKDMKISLRTKLIGSSLAVIIIFGVAVTLVGIRLIADGLISQTQDRVRTDLNSARRIYHDEIKETENLVRLTGTRFFIKNALLGNDRETLQRELNQIREYESLDVLTLTDENGRVTVRSRNPAVHGDSQADDELVSQVLSRKKVVAGTVIVPKEELTKEGEDLAQQVYMKVIPTPKAKQSSEAEESSAMMIKAAAPVLNGDGSLVGVLYGGRLLNRNYEIVDDVKSIVYQGVKYKGKEIGTATIFQGDLRISTNVKREDGSRAIGTRVSEEVYEQVLVKGLPWMHKAFVVNSWYIAAYEPIKDVEGKIVGILCVGVLEQKFVDMRRRAILIFLGITLVGMIIALTVSSLLASGILKPLEHLVLASRQLAKGNLECRVKLKSRDEMGELGETFNLMASSLKDRDERLKEHTERQIMKLERLATLGQLAGGVAHEINNPLGTISIYAQMALDELGKDNDSCKEDLKVVMKQTNRAGKIVKDLLEFARQFQPEMRTVNVNDVLGKAIRMTTHPAQLKDVRVITQLTQGLPSINGDSDKLQQVFVNIIVNALQAMTKGGELTVSTRLTEDNEFIEIEISDTGCGIPEEHLGKLFDPFFSTKEIGKGTGLGLSVSLGIVQKHNGSINVRSKVGQGSTFIVRLPAEGKKRK